MGKLTKTKVADLALRQCLGVYTFGIWRVYLVDIFQRHRVGLSFHQLSQAKKQQALGGIHYLGTILLIAVGGVV